MADFVRSSSDSVHEREMEQEILTLVPKQNLFSFLWKRSERNGKKTIIEYMKWQTFWPAIFDIAINRSSYNKYVLEIPYNSCYTLIHIWFLFPPAFNW